MIFPVGPRVLSPLGRAAAANLLAGFFTSFWKMDEATGQPRADFIGAETLTNNNSVSQIAGLIGNASHFVRASSQYLSRASDLPIQLDSDQSWTFSAWYKPVTNSVAQVVVAKGNGTHWAYLLYVAGNGHVYCYTSNGVVDGFADYPLGNLSAGVWHHLLGWYDKVAQTINLRVDHGTTYSSAWANGVWTESNALVVGGGFSGLYVDGDVDALGWSKGKAPSAAVQDALWNSGNGWEPS